MSFKPRFQPSYLSWINSDRPRRATAVLLPSSCVWGEHTVKRITLQQFVTFDSWISFLSIEPRNLILMQSYQYILSSSAEHQVPSRSHSRTSWGLVHLMRLHFLILGAKFFSEKYFLDMSHSYICNMRRWWPSRIHQQCLWACTQISSTFVPTCQTVGYSLKIS